MTRVLASTEAKGQKQENNFFFPFIIFFCYHLLKKRQEVVRVPVIGTHPLTRESEAF